MSAPTLPRPAPAPGREGQQRLRFLDEIRGAAVVAVVSFHVLATMDRGVKRLPFFLWPVAAGRLGVDAFFVLSGFVLLKSWQAHDRNGAGPARFFVRRARRLLPAYWVSLVVLVALRARHLLTSSHGLVTLVLHATGQQFLSRTASWEINSAYWTLTPQIHFYLLFPLLMVALRKVRPSTVLIALVCVSVAFRLLLRTADQWPADTIIGRIDQFAVGMAAACAASSCGRVLGWLRSRAATWASFAGIATLLFAYGSFWGRSMVERAWPETVVHPLLSLLLGVALLRSPSGGASPSILRRGLGSLGTISYSIYLWHLPLLNWFGRLGAPGMICAIFSTLVVGKLSYLVLERPLPKFSWQDHIPKRVLSLVGPAPARRSIDLTDVRHAESG